MDCNIFETLPDRLAAKTEKAPGGCLLWTGAKRVHGYGVLTYKGRLILAHRAALACHLGRPEMLEKVAAGQGPFAPVYVLHSCDNPPCINPEHLRLGSAADNAEDATARNRRSPYAGNRLMKLDASAVREIREVAKTWDGLCDMMKKHKVHQGTIQAVVDRKAHNHVPD